MELTAMAPKRSSPEFTTLEASSVMDADLTGELADINITEPGFSGVVRPPSWQGSHLHGPCSNAPISPKEDPMVPKVEKPAVVLDASRTESTFPETSAATDASQMDAVAPTNNPIEPDSSEDAVSTGTEDLNMETTLAPNAAQEQDKEHVPFAEVEYLPATDDEGSRQAPVTNSEKKAESRAIRNDLARLAGLRFALCAKVNTGKYLDDSLVKRAIGI